MRENEEKNIIFGIRPLEEALSKNTTFLKVYVQKGIGESLKFIKQILNRHHVIYTEVPIEKLNSLSRNGNHQGVVAKISPIKYYVAEELAKQLIEKDKEPCFIALDRITDVRNFGAIARTAHAAGFAGVIIPEKNSVTVSEDAIKTSAGALLHLPVCRTGNFFQTIKHLKDDGFQIICGSEKANKELYFEPLTRPCVVVVGNEEEGIHPTILKLANKLVKIPMNSELDSLNVSVAAAIIMYEVVRQNMVDG
jgi:23S rRNA (guanosine2251-2'-O)-methyltransferase